MKADNRNTTVVVCLVLAMTAGARILLWLEPGSSENTAAAPLTAADGTPVEDVVISLALPGDIDQGATDCLVWPDGKCEWQARGTHVRMVVVGSAERDSALPEAQKRNLLAALGSMTQARGWALVPVRLDSASDVRCNSTLSQQAADLYALLADKGIIE